MKLIDEKEVEWQTPMFKAGVRFAEQKLQPMMVELIDYIDENQWNDNVASLEKLEQFLKTKQR